MDVVVVVVVPLIVLCRAGAAGLNSKSLSFDTEPLASNQST